MDQFRERTFGRERNIILFFSDKNRFDSVALCNLLQCELLGSASIKALNNRGGEIGEQFSKMNTISWRMRGKGFLMQQNIVKVEFLLVNSGEFRLNVRLKIQTLFTKRILGLTESPKIPNSRQKCQYCMIKRLKNQNKIVCFFHKIKENSIKHINSIK